MLKKIKQHFNKGVFKHYFVGKFIETREDHDKYLGFYCDRVCALTMASLYGLKLSANNSEVQAVGHTGKQSKMTFTFTANQLRDGKDMITDVQSLMDFEKFLMEEVETLLNDGTKFECFGQFLDFTYKTLNLNNSRPTNDNYYFKELNAGMFECSRDQIFALRPQTNNCDEDIIMAAAYNNVRWLDAMVAKKLNYSQLQLSDLGYATSKFLAMEFQTQLDERQKAREMADQVKINDENMQLKYWNYFNQSESIRKQRAEMENMF